MVLRPGAYANQLLTHPWGTATVRPNFPIVTEKKTRLDSEVTWVWLSSWTLTSSCANSHP